MTIVTGVQSNFLKDRIGAARIVSMLHSWALVHYMSVSEVPFLGGRGIRTHVV